MKTINISLPTIMYQDVKQLLQSSGYSSFSEFVRDILRESLYREDKNKITENGFPVWFEDRVLEAAREPIDKSKTWETEEDVHTYFRDLRKRLNKRQHGKG